MRNQLIPSENLAEGNFDHLHSYYQLEPNICKHFYDNYFVGIKSFINNFISYQLV